MPYSHGGKYTILLWMLALCLMLNGLSACSYLRGDKGDSSGSEQEQEQGQGQGRAIAPEPQTPLTSSQAADQLYIQAIETLDADNYQEAARLFEELERQYPYSRWATKSQLMAAYATYQALDYPAALAALDRFIELHPGHEDVDYAYYLKALSYYEQISDVSRDQSRTRAALNSLDLVSRRFPNSKYARDAAFKRDLTLNHLAGKEMEVGRFYLERNQINAAINRFRNVIEYYQTTTHAPEALHRLVECYKILGLNAQAQKIAAVLGYNYPGSKWYEYSYRLFDEQELKRLQSQEKNWLNKTIDGLSIDGLFGGEKDVSDQLLINDFSSKPVIEFDVQQAEDVIFERPAIDQYDVDELGQGLDDLQEDLSEYEVVPETKAAPQPITELPGDEAPAEVPAKSSAEAPIESGSKKSESRFLINDDFDLGVSSE